MRIHLLPDPVREARFWRYSGIGLTRDRAFSAILVSLFFRTRADRMELELPRHNRGRCGPPLTPPQPGFLISAVVSLYKGKYYRSKNFERRNTP